MKNIFILPALALLACLSCAKESYPPIVYTNKSARDITFRTTEKDSPLYKLSKWNSAIPSGSTLTLDSDERGRTAIFAVYPPYIGWSWKNNDIYAIEFDHDSVKVPAIPLHITNQTTEAITLTEKQGYLYQETGNSETVDVPAAADASTPGQETAAIYTKTPQFELSGNTYPAKVSFQYNAGTNTMEALLTSGH
jgi:hypothetical protein